VPPRWSPRPAQRPPGAWRRRKGARPQRPDGARRGQSAQGAATAWGQGRAAACWAIPARTPAGGIAARWIPGPGTLALTESVPAREERSRADGSLSSMAATIRACRYRYFLNSR
jgi:hypothetical protein